MNIVQKEIEWFADHRIEFIFCCDANFGILPRDLDIARYIAKVKEKTGLGIRLISENGVEALTNDFFPEGQHYVTLYLKAEHIKGNPRVREPEKCERWRWFTWGNLPQPLFLPVQNLVNQTYDPFEYDPFGLAPYRHTHYQNIGRMALNRDGGADGG